MLVEVRTDLFQTTYRLDSDPAGVGHLGVVADSGDGEAVARILWLGGSTVARIIGPHPDVLRWVEHVLQRLADLTSSLGSDARLDGMDYETEQTNHRVHLTRRKPRHLR